MSRLLSAFFLVVLSCLLSTIVSYRIGDAIDTIIRTETSAEDALRHQMPIFGVSSTASFDVTEKFALAFEEGLRPLPFISADSLDKLEVIFVYSKSGTIHSISSTSHLGVNKSKFVRVHYKWVEEENVDIVGAGAVMFLATFLATITMLIQACAGTSFDDEADHHHVSAAHSHVISNQGAAFGIPKWD